MMNNIKKIFIGLIIGMFFIILMVCLHYHNEIYVWTIGDVNSIYNQAEKSYKEGDVVSTEFNSKDFGRIAAQTAKQVLIQNFKA